MVAWFGTIRDRINRGNKSQAWSYPWYQYTNCNVGMRNLYTVNQAETAQRWSKQTVKNTIKKGTKTSLQTCTYVDPHEHAWNTTNTVVVRIRGILVRIQIRESVPLANGSGSCYFFTDLQDAYKKLFFPKFKFFCLILFEGTSFFKDKKS